MYRFHFKLTWFVTVGGMTSHDQLNSMFYLASFLLFTYFYTCVCTGPGPGRPLHQHMTILIIHKTGVPPGGGGGGVLGNIFGREAQHKLAKWTQLDLTRLKKGGVNRIGNWEKGGQLH